MTVGPPAAAAAAWQALAPALAGSPRMRVSRDGGRTYPRRGEQELSREVPDRPATIPVYADNGTGHLLACDFDVARARGTGARDPAGQVTAQAAGFAALVAALGGRCVADRSPKGGRHVYVLFAAPLPWRELRDLCRALSVRYPALDPAPMAGPGGQIRPPGARHRSGGWQALETDLQDAVAALAAPCGPAVWEGLLREFAAELAATAPVATAGAAPAGAEPADDGTAWLPRPGGRTGLPPVPAAIATTGTWPSSRYAGRSEARMAVITAAAACGWQLAEVRDEIAAGRWAGLAALYARRSEPRRMTRLLPAEWQKAVNRLAGEKNNRHCHTSDRYSRPPTATTDARQASEYGAIRMWVTATDCAVTDPHRRGRWGGHAIAVRLVLAALGQAAMVSGSRVVEFGIRNLALHAGVSYRTVARVLVLLREEPDPLIDLVTSHNLWRADRYMLRIPVTYAEQARWRRRRAGRIEAIHPVFAVLGGTAALTYAALSSDEATAADVARTAALRQSSVAAALRILGTHGLAVHGPRGWRRGPVSCDDAASETGADEARAERQATYAADRASWRLLIDAWLSLRGTRRIAEDTDSPYPRGCPVPLARSDKTPRPARGTPAPVPA